MSLSRRELTLGILTGTIALVGVSYMVGERKITQWRQAVDQRQKFLDEKRVNDRTLSQRTERQTRIEGLRGKLPSYPLGQPVTAELLKLIKQKADQHQLGLPQMRPSDEKSVGDLSEVAIACAWDGTLEAVTHFLHDIQQQGAMMDVRELTMQPATGQNQAGKLKGNLTVYCAFVRISETTGAVERAKAPDA